MRDALVWLLNLIASINWLEVLKALAPAVTAGIAFVALRNWQRQDKAKRELEFIDSLIEATHAYIVQISSSITILEIVKIGMRSHAPTSEDEDREVKGAIAYITEKGEQDAKHLHETLDAALNSVTRLQSLATKGQIFKFAGYTKCFNAVQTLVWQFDKAQALMSVIRSSTWNWENPEVLQHLENVMEINPDDIRTSVKASNIAILEFASEAYEGIYG